MIIQPKLSTPTLKSQLNTKSVMRRKRQADDVRIADAAARAARNDLLPKLNVVTRSTDSLKNGPGRSRRTSAAQLARVIDSVRAFGLVVPLLIDRNDVIIAGHVVRDAALALSLIDVPCIVTDHLSDAEARLLAVTLNRLGETGEWDLDALKIELSDLGLLNLDLTVTGFSMPEIDIILLGDAAGAPEDEPEANLKNPPASRPGDLWVLGGHRLLCGDALEEASYGEVMDGAMADAVFSDPPCNCKIAGFVGGLGKHKHGDFAMAVGEMSDDAFHAFLRSYLQLCKAHLNPGAVVYACMDWRQIDRLLGAAAAAGLKRINMAVWNKGSGGMGLLYRSAYELVAVFCNGASPATNNVELGRHGRDRTNVWTIAGANRSGSSAGKALADHPTPKPVELVADALLDVTNRGAIVLDPFMGSGTTMIAAERTGRRARGIELDPKYVDVAVRRWEKLGLGEAVHAVTGQTFAETAADRVTDTRDRETKG